MTWRRLHVAVDMDDVMLEFVPFLYQAFKTEFGITLPYDGDPWGKYAVAFRDGTNHTVWKELGYEDWWGWLRERDWLWGIMPAIEGAIGSVQLMRARGYRVEALTKKPDWAKFTVWKWCRDWRPAFHTVTIVPSSEKKHDWSTADVLIDDSFDNCRDWAATGRHAILFDPAGVRHPDTMGPRMVHVTSWAATMAALRDLEVMVSGAAD